MHYPVAKHDDAPGIALFTSRSEIEQKAAPNANLALIISFEPDAAQIDGIIKQHNVHGFAVAVNGLKYRVFNSLGTPPVPHDESRQQKPEKGFQCHSIDGLVQNGLRAKEYPIGEGGYQRADSLCPLT